MPFATRPLVLVLLLWCAVTARNVASAAEPADAAPARTARHVAQVTIVRDDWGIAHVHGRTDADAVFGMVYAQAEDDFNRVEMNYLTALGRVAEADGEAAVWQDLRMKLFVEPASLQAQFKSSPAWLRTLMTAWADGLNFYLQTHPHVQPRVLRHFEPWMALSFSEGSIGGDIERVSLSQLEAFYGQHPVALTDDEAGRRFVEPKGSNGFAIAPSHTAGGHALLLINPHTSFFFRSELQMTSDDGLNAYGAVTWGQFFVYQGFNERAGWMHTSSGVDNVDEFAETIVRDGDRLRYGYGRKLRQVRSAVVTVPYRTADGGTASRTFTVYRTHHGPIVRAADDGKWISIALMQKPVAALQQSFLRTKAHDLAGFVRVAQLRANSSNNTLFADRGGEIAYLHPQFIPVRDDRFDYTRPVDGSDPATDWHGLHTLASLPQVRNPANGWVMNTNDAPWTAAGNDSPQRERYPRYMDTFGENPRGEHATLVLGRTTDFTLDSLIAAAYDPYLPAFARLIPLLTEAAGRATAERRAALQDQLALLQQWDCRWSAESTATSLAVFWGEALWAMVAEAPRAAGVSVYDAMATQTTDDQKLDALAAASDRLAHDFGDWRTPWGEINRYQRLNGALEQPFDDAAPSLPVPFTSAQWGSLASFGAHRYPGTRRYYGTSGNSFVAVVEFGDTVRAKALSAGGESGDPASPHFADQAPRYGPGALRDVYFDAAQLAGHVERSYHPGD